MGKNRKKRRFEKQTNKHYEHTFIAHVFSSILGTLSETFAHISGILIGFIGGSLVLRGNIQIGELIGFQMFLNHLYGSIQRFADVNATIQKSITNDAPEEMLPLGAS